MWDGVPVRIEAGDEILLPLLLPVMPPERYEELELWLSFPSEGEVELRLWTNPALWLPPVSPRQCT